MSRSWSAVRRHAAINPEGAEVEYLALIYADEAAWESLQEDERAGVYERYAAFARDAREAGVLTGGDELCSTADATTVRVRNAQVAVTDGPYAEAKEALGGYFLLECASLDEAVEWAARIPAAEHGAVEVRPVHVDSEEG
jgi:hypothetical protein